ncbi:MAG TPA: NAD(P)H-flavin reductase [Legionella sp.]|nr:NAD(P)H-flavin reductase [Legionella sp.]
MSGKIIQARVESITPLTDSILQLMLKPDEYIDYQAGQYLQMLFENEAFSYSIANAPLGSRQYELHIRHTRDNPYHQPLFAHIKRHGVVTLQLPLGACHVSRLDAVKPILFIAGGTGFAPIKAMIEQLLADGEPRPFELFWGARAQRDLYMDDKAMHWQTHVAHFTYFPHRSEPQGMTLADRVLAQHRHDIQDWQMVLSGPFDMVYHTRDALVAAGVLPEHLFSDAFSF